MDAAEARAKLAYDTETGIFRWRARADVGLPWNRRFAGKVAGTPDADGYVMIRINERPYKAHRLAWLVVHGQWPVGEIDHINGDPADNRFENLRAATRGQNSQNTAGWRRKTLPIGVQRRCDGKAFIARIMLNRQFIHLGSFPSPELAHAAYLRASRELRGEYART